MIISLATELLQSSCSLPSAERVTPLRLLGFAPGGVCLAADITAGAGGLLHHRFTLALVELCSTLAIFFSVALCRRVAPPGC